MLGQNEHAFASCAPRLYNKLPIQLKNMNDVVQFKKKLKTFLFERCYDTTDARITASYKTN